MVNLGNLAIKRIPLRQKEFYELRLFKAKKGLGTYNKTIRFLLKKVR